MKVLVTVGTSSFDSLIDAVDTQLDKGKFEVTCQIANGLYHPVNHDYITFTKEFDELISGADVIITHAGAGTVFELLEKRKTILVVPNLERIDKHQLDLTNFIEKNEYGLTCKNLNLLSAQLEKCQDFKRKDYLKEPFFMTNDIIQYLS